MNRRDQDVDVGESRNYTFLGPKNVQTNGLDAALSEGPVDGVVVRRRTGDGFDLLLLANLISSFLYSPEFL